MCEVKYSLILTVKTAQCLCIFPILGHICFSFSVVTVSDHTVSVGVCMTMSMTTLSLQVCQ